MKTAKSVNVDHIDDVYTRLRLREINLTQAARELEHHRSKSERPPMPGSLPSASVSAMHARARRKK